MTSLLERFDAKMMPEPMSGCWLWTGAITSSGYGSIQVGPGRITVAHRVSYEMHVGPVPAGLELDHLCRVRSCVNPAHLEPVTHRENVLRGDSPRVAWRVDLKRAQTHCVNGHEFTSTNTYTRPNGTRRCRACNAAISRSRRVARSAFASREV